MPVQQAVTFCRLYLFCQLQYTVLVWRRFRSVTHNRWYAQASSSRLVVCQCPSRVVFGNMSSIIIQSYTTSGSLALDRRRQRCAVKKNKMLRGFKTASIKESYNFTRVQVAIAKVCMVILSSGQPLTRCPKH